MWPWGRRRGPGRAFHDAPSSSCINCGLLARWDIVRDQLVEVPNRDRTSGLDTYTQHPNDHPGRVACWQHAYDLHAEFQIALDALKLGSDGGSGRDIASEAMAAVLRKDRSSCRWFVEWNPALSLVEHFAKWREDVMHRQSIGLARLSVVVAFALGIASIIAGACLRAGSPNVQKVVVVTPTASATLPTPAFQPGGTPPALLPQERRN